MADLDTYLWTYCTFDARYGDVNASMQFGDNWEFVSAPEAAWLRQITLHYEGLCYYTIQTSTGLEPDLATSPATNAWLLEHFYQAHLRHVPFYFPIDGWGTIRCRFKETLETAKGIPNGGGWTEPFEVVLQEIRS